MTAAVSSQLRTRLDGVSASRVDSRRDGDTGVQRSRPARRRHSGLELDQPD